MGFTHRFFLYNVLSILTTITIFTVMFYQSQGNIIENYSKVFPFSVAVFAIFYTIIIESLFFRKKNESR